MTSETQTSCNASTVELGSLGPAGRQINPPTISRPLVRQQLPVAPRRFVQATVDSVCNSVSCWHIDGHSDGHIMRIHSLMSATNEVCTAGGDDGRAFPRHK